MNLLRLETKKKNTILTHLNILTARVSIKQTVITVHSENIDLTKIDTARSHKSSKKLKPIQFTHCDFQISKSIFIFIRTSFSLILS